MLTIKKEVLSLLKRKVSKRKTKMFTGYDINSLNAWGDSLRESSHMRALRALRQDGVIDYDCVDRKRSKYQLKRV